MSRTFTDRPIDCRRRFMEVVDALCRELGTEPVARHRDEMHTLVVDLELEGSAVSLWHAMSPCPAHLLLRARLPLPQEDGRGDALLRLLHLNHDLGPDAGACLSLDPDTGDGCVGLCVELATAHRVGVAASLASLGRMVAGWRELMMTTVRRPEEAMRFGPVGRA